MAYAEKLFDIFNRRTLGSSSRAALSAFEGDKSRIADMLFVVPTKERP
jgi:hypothetical protein